LIPALLVILITTLCIGQDKTMSDQLDLSEFSDEQLKACFDNSKICGTSDIYQITDEFVRRLPKLSSDQLVACFDDWKICGTGEGQAEGWPISDELARRGNVNELLVRYWKEPKWTIRSGIEDVAYHFDTPEVTKFMRKILAERVDDGEDRYWPVNYLAKKCDPVALKELSSGRYRNQGSMQYENSVELFGKCKYRPAIPYMVDTAIYDMSLNVVDAVRQSLQVLYPDGPREFNSLDSMQKYYCSRAKQEGLKVNCETK
jgi:hypothetical protein